MRRGPGTSGQPTAAWGRRRTAIGRSRRGRGRPRRRPTPVCTDVGDRLPVAQRRIVGFQSCRPSTRLLSTRMPTSDAPDGPISVRTSTATALAVRFGSLPEFRVRAVDHRPGVRSPALRRAARRCAFDVGRRVVGRGARRASTTMAVGVAAVPDDARDAVDVDAEETCADGAPRPSRRARPAAAVGAVLEADGHGEARSPSRGASGSRSCARRSPPRRRRSGDVLRRDRIEQLAAARRRRAVTSRQHLARELERPPRRRTSRRGAGR
jgi:hypothetical protein